MARTVRSYTSGSGLLTNVLWCRYENYACEWNADAARGNGGDHSQSSVAITGAFNLSGGNRQKTVLARWLFTKSKILIFDEPTVGIDVGVKYEIYVLMNRLAAEGIGVRRTNHRRAVHYAGRREPSATGAA